MKEFKSILEAFEKVDFSKRRAALAMVVKVKGSSYRSPGARMLITDDGHWVGSISGGCLEGDALRKARLVMESGKAMTITYDTTQENGSNLGIGLGCNGIIDILIEPIDPKDSKNPISYLRSLVAFKDLGISATIFHLAGNKFKIGDKWVLQPSGEILSWNSSQEIPPAIEKDLQMVFSDKKPKTKMVRTDQGEMEVFYELIQPSITLTIFGGGFDVKPVVQLGKMLAWDVTVTDECVAHVVPSQFPGANSVLHCQKEFVAQNIHLDTYSAAVIMSHSYEYDKAVLRQILDTKAFYVGILGPRKRTDQIFDEFEKDGIKVPSEFLSKVHSPIGLDIGAETPDEIALSIISEILSLFSGRSGGLLKYRQGPIHERDRKSGQVFKEVYLKSVYEKRKSG